MTEPGPHELADAFVKSSEAITGSVHLSVEQRAAIRGLLEAFGLKESTVCGFAMEAGGHLHVIQTTGETFRNPEGIPSRRTEIRSLPE